MPELRKDPIVGRWIIIATERGVRPSDYTARRPPLDDETFCPFCPGNESATTPEVLAYRNGGGGGRPNAPGWSLRVVPNKFPALKIEGELGKRGVGLYDMMNGVGAHEVIIETAHHDLFLWELPQGRIEDVLWAYRDRMLDLRNDPRFRYVVIFKNHGAAAGATIEHAHSQLIALPILPKQVEEEMEGAQRYFEFRERCVFCDILTQEAEQGERIVYETEHVVALAPFASRFPFETWFIPRRHASNFETSTKGVLQDLARALKVVLSKLDRALDDPPFNFMLHTAPFAAAPLEHYHWHIELIPTLTQVAGFEWGTGFHINPTPPENAASFLRSTEIDI